MKLEFPKESVEQARDVVSKYRKRYADKKNMAHQLHAGKFLEIYYGFTDALKSGNCGRYLHEIERDADCFTMAGALYLVAREANLQPKLYLAQRVDDQHEGELNEGSLLADHTFLTVSIGKNKEYLVDPFMGAFGKTTFNPNRNRITIYDPDSRRLIERDYASIQELTEQDYLERLEKNRTSEGGRIALSCTQKVIGPKKIRTSVNFSPENNEIKSSLIFPKSSFRKKPYQHKIYDLATKVNDDGTFDFNQGTLSFYNAEKAGWSEHIGPSTPLRYSTQDALQFSNAISKIIKQTGRKSPIDFVGRYKLTNKLKVAGLNNDFSINSNSIAESVLDNQEIYQIKDSQQMCVEDYLKRIQGDGLAFKNLLQKTRYLMASDNAKSFSNPEGFVFTKEEHQRLIQESFQDYEKATMDVSEASIRAMAVRAKLSNGTRYSSDRDFNRSMGRALKDIKYFTEMAQARDSPFKLVYSILADRDLFDKDFDIENVGVQELQKGLTEQDIKKTASKSLFNFLIGFSSWRRCLMLPSFQKGLEKILKID